LSDVEIKWSDVKPKWRDECFFKEELQTRLEEQVGLKTALCAQLAELMERHRRAESRALQDIFGGDGESVRTNRKKHKSVTTFLSFFTYIF